MAILSNVKRHVLSLKDIKDDFLSIYGICLVQQAIINRPAVQYEANIEPVVNLSLHYVIPPVRIKRLLVTTPITLSHAQV